MTDEKLLINIFIDKEFKFSQLVDPQITISDLKKIILTNTSIYSLNYIIEYQDREISGLEMLTLNQIFQNKKKDEYNLYLTLISTLKKYEKQTVLISYIEGTSEIIVYKVLSMKWLKIIPEMSNRLSFYETKKFPYNSRSCHILQTNQLIITGGVDNEYTSCYFDADTNSVIDFPKMKHPRQRHSMIYIGNNKVLIIGGSGSKKVTCLNIEFEDYEDLPDLNYTRKDASVCFVNNKFIYVFMGYCDEKGGILSNYEKLNVNNNDNKWNILPMNNYYSLNVPRTYSAVTFIRNDWKENNDNDDNEDNDSDDDYKGFFLFFGGSFNSTSQSNVFMFSEEKYQVDKSNFNLPLKCNFRETFFVQPNEINSDCYLFTFGQNHELIHFNYKKNILEEIPQEWIE